MFGKLKQELRGSLYYLWWVVLLAMVAPSFLSRTGSDPQKAPIITVNGDALTMVQFKRQYSMMQSERMIFNQRYGLNLDTNIDPVAVLNRGAEGLLLDSVASAQNFVVDQSVLGMMIKNSLAEALGFSPNAFSMDFYNYYVRQIGMTVREFEQDQETMVKRALVDEAVRAAAYAPEFAKQSEGLVKKSFGLLRFSKDTYVKALKAQGAVSADDLSAFYNENKEMYALPDLKNAAYVVIDPRQYEKDVTVSDEQIEAFYARRKDSLYKEKDQFKMRRMLISVPAGSPEADVAQFKKKAEELVILALKKQESFADIVTKASDDEKTAKKGGLTETFTAGTYAPQLEAELMKLENPDDITPVVRTAEGFECAQLVSKHLGSYKKLDSVRKEIISTITKRTALDQLKADIDAVLRSGQDGEIDLNSFASQHGIKLEETGEFDTSATNGDSLKSEIAKKVFGSFVAKPSARGSFIFHEKHVVFVVTSSKTSRYEALEAISSRVQDDLINKKALQALDEDVSSAQKAFFDGEYSLATLQKEFPQATLQETGLIKHKDTVKGCDKDHGVTEKLFMLEAPGMLARVALKDGDVLLGVLFASEPLSDNTHSEKGDKGGSDLHDKAENNLMRGFVASLKRTAKIDIINEQFFSAQ